VPATTIELSSVKAVLLPEPDAFGNNSARGYDQSLLHVSLVALDEEEPELPPGDDVLLLAVSAGFATEEQLARLALAALDTGQTIDGIVLVNPDLGDRTTGSFFENSAYNLNNMQGNRSGRISHSRPGTSL
jgi:hypothetical protein